MEQKITIGQAALDSGIKYSTMLKYKRVGCSPGWSYKVAEDLANWDMRKNRVSRRQAFIDPGALLTPEGFWVEVVRICPEINQKGRGRPKK